MTSDFNPYASPQVTEIRDKPTDDESVRREFLSHEASVQSIGSLYTIATAVLVISLVPTWIDLARIGALNGLALVTATISSGGLAYGLLKLKPWARIPAILAAVLGLFAVPCGTVISVYVLYLLCSRKGRMVFSPEYRRVIDATPQINYRTPRIFWIVLIVIALLLVVGSFVIFG